MSLSKQIRLLRVNLLPIDLPRLDLLRLDLLPIDLLHVCLQCYVDLRCYVADAARVLIVVKKAVVLTLEPRRVC